MKKLWKPKKTLQQNLHRKLPAMAASYFEAGREAMAPETTWETMHQFRLATKRFRYTLETFREAYGPGLEARIEALRQIQTFLGDINDCIVTSAMVEDDKVRSALSSKAEAKTRKLRSFWAKVFDAPGECDRWTGYLGRYACRRRVSRAVTKT